MSNNDLILLNEQIAGIARAGLPLDQGLASLARDLRRGRLQRVTAQLASDLNSGMTLEDAIANQPQRMPAYYAGLVALGAKTGKIGEVLALLTNHARTIGQMKAIVSDALYYPAFVAVTALLMSVVLLGFVVPKFQEMITELNSPLPMVTRGLYSLSGKIVQWAAVGVAGALVLLLACRVVLGVNEKGRTLWTRFVYRVPLAGRMIRSARLAAFTELLGILVDHEVPLPEAVSWAGDASDDPLVRQGCSAVRADLARGATLADALRAHALVPDWAAWMAGLGEKRGSLGTSLHLIADMYRRQTEKQVLVFRNLVPPLIVVGTGLVLGGFYIALLFLPMVRILETIVP